MVREATRSRRRAWRAVGALLFGVGLVIAGVDRDRSTEPDATASPGLESQRPVCGDSRRSGIAGTDSPIHFDRNPGSPECPTPLPIVHRAYGEDAYGSGPYGR